MGEEEKKTTTMTSLHKCLSNRGSQETYIACDFFGLKVPHKTLMIHVVPC